MRALIVVALCLFATSAALAGAGGCRNVHGRLTLANGNPSVRIWVIGTQRVLGVVQRDESFGDLPSNIRRLWAAHGDDAMWSSYLYGDFTVCPVTRSEPGRMQLVRLTGGTHLRAQPQS
jgi:hypothetical protein